jgi:hypothetical protein
MLSPDGDTPLSSGAMLPMFNPIVLFSFLFIKKKERLIQARAIIM